MPARRGHYKYHQREVGQLAGAAIGHIIFYQSQIGNVYQTIVTCKGLGRNRAGFPEAGVTDRPSGRIEIGRRLAANHPATSAHRGQAGRNLGRLGRAQLPHWRYRKQMAPCLR